MKIKTLLLSSAAAVIAAGGAQAADLSIAEPVEYVRVCDAFGVGYWYIGHGYLHQDRRQRRIHDQDR